MHRLLFAKEGRARYISHLDLMRTFQRAFQRAGLTIKHTEGFNPHPFISILLPLSVGFSSRCEILEFELVDGTPLDQVPGRLNAAMPEGINVLDCYESGRKAKELTFVNYEIDLHYDSGLPADARQSMENLLAGKRLEVVKKSKRGESTVDVIPLVKEYAFSETEAGLRLTVTLCAQNPGLNPQILVRALEEGAPGAAADFAAYHRRGVLDAAGNPFM